MNIITQIMKKLFTTILVCLVAVTMMAQGYSTYYNSSNKVTVPTGVAAYIVTGVNNGKLTYQKIADGDTEKKVVTAGTAVLLYTGDENTGDVNPAFTTNLLHGSDTKTTTSGGGAGAKYYKLTYGNDNTPNASVFGWYWGAAGGAAFTSPAHKAWLALPANSGAPVFLGLPGEDPTGIASVENRQQRTENVWYDLSGRRINAPKTKGIYIKDGRKVVIK